MKLTKSVIRMIFPPRLTPFAASVICLVLSTPLSQVYAVTQPELLGTPFEQTYPREDQRYARNIWDMQLYKDRIYLGAGNSSNKGPAPNAGRVPVIYYDLKLKRFRQEYQVAEEQIERYSLLGNQLWIPGHDATQKWTFGNIYRLDSGWSKLRTLPEALHVYDLNRLDNLLFAAVGLNKRGGVYVSRDEGKSWTDFGLGSGRVYALLKVQGQLFAARTLQAGRSDKVSLFQWHSERQNFIPRADLTPDRMLPDTQPGRQSVKITKTAELAAGTFYIAGFSHNDHQSRPLALYYATLTGLSPPKDIQIERIPLPEGYLPRDLLVRENSIYLLASKNTGSGFNNRVFRLLVESDSPLTRQSAIQFEKASFDAATFARSFELSGACYFFGLGGEIDDPEHWSPKEVAQETGQILRLCP